MYVQTTRKSIIGGKSNMPEILRGRHLAGIGDDRAARGSAAPALILSVEHLTVYAGIHNALSGMDVAIFYMSNNNIWRNIYYIPI